VLAVQQKLNSTLEQLLYAYLEAREEQENLIKAGLGQQEIERVGTIPNIPFDPLAILRRVKAVGTGDD